MVVLSSHFFLSLLWERLTFWSKNFCDILINAVLPSGFVVIFADQLMNGQITWLIFKNSFILDSWQLDYAQYIIEYWASQDDMKFRGKRYWNMDWNMDSVMNRQRHSETFHWKFFYYKEIMQYIHMQPQSNFFLILNNWWLSVAWFFSQLPALQRASSVQQHADTVK